MPNSLCALVKLYFSIIDRRYMMTWILQQRSLLSKLRSVMKSLEYFRVIRTYRLLNSSNLELTLTRMKFSNQD